MSLRTAWDAFVSANTVQDAISSHDHLTKECGVGSADFAALHKALSASSIPYRSKQLINLLLESNARRPCAENPLDVVVSGAGPCGLRGAVELAMCGHRVTVLEKRVDFSRVNILMLWKQTANDLLSLGAKAYFPTFNDKADIIHMGTRSIQLTLLKNALLMGVSFSYGAELVAVQAPATSSGKWRALGKPAGIPAAAHAAGAVGFKQCKLGAYEREKHEGRCNMTQRNSLDATFALSADVTLPGGLVSLPFDALLIAEGEWSNSCNRLGIDKAVNVFSQAIGLIINMNYDAKDAAERQLRDRVVRPNDDGEHKRIVDDLKKAGVDFEFIEYLKGETHYIVVTITKASLLGLGALRADLPRERLLERSNVDEEKLLGAARTVATIFGLPAESSFCDFHPVKLFDFSSRAKALCGYKVLGVCTGGSQQGQVSSLDIEAHDELGIAEAAYFERALPELRATAMELQEATDDDGRSRLTERTRLAKLERLHQARADIAALEEAQRAFKERVEIKRGLTSLVPVFPVGDSLLEPFWPQGLGSNRGFHSALDAAWAVHVLSVQGLQASLLERNFAYDLMMQMNWFSKYIKKGEAWRTDPLYRYSHSQILETIGQYTDPLAKRLYRGTDAVPARIASAGLKNDVNMLVGGADCGEYDPPAGLVDLISMKI